MSFEKSVTFFTDHPKVDDEIAANLVCARLLSPEKIYGVFRQIQDLYNPGHADRMEGLARVISEDLGLPKDWNDMIGRAAHLHDLGMVVLPADAYAGSGKYARLHPLFGSRLAAKVAPVLREGAQDKTYAHDIADIILYQSLLDLAPDDAIKTGVRIVCLAYAFDMLESDDLFVRSEQRAIQGLELIDSLNIGPFEKPIEHLFSLPQFKEKISLFQP